MYCALKLTGLAWFDPGSGTHRVSLEFLRGLRFARCFIFRKWLISRFVWAALHVARWGGGSSRKLFAFIILLGAAVSVLFANDGAALILTPIVIAMLLPTQKSRNSAS